MENVETVDRTDVALCAFFFGLLGVHDLMLGCSIRAALKMLLNVVAFITSDFNFHFCLGLLIILFGWTALDLCRISRSYDSSRLVGSNCIAKKLAAGYALLAFPVIYLSFFVLM